MWPWWGFRWPSRSFLVTIDNILYLATAKQLYNIGIQYTLSLETHSLRLPVCLEHVETTHSWQELHFDIYK